MDQDKNTQTQNPNRPDGCCGGQGSAEAHTRSTGGQQPGDTDKAARFTSKLKQKWNRLSDDDLALANENRDQLLDRISKTQGLSKDDAERQLSEIENDCGMRAGDTCGV